MWADNALCNITYHISYVSISLPLYYFLDTFNLLYFIFPSHSSMSLWLRFPSYFFSLSPPHLLYYPPFCSLLLSLHPFFFFLSFPLSCLNPSIIYFLPSSHLSVPPPSLLNHSIFVLVQLQKWDLAVTNLLAKPPRAPCGGASSQRTRVIDWTWGKRCQAGHHDWISCLIINSLLPQVLWGDTGDMWWIFMTHGALDYYSWSSLPHFYFLLCKQSHSLSTSWVPCLWPLTGQHICVRPIKSWMWKKNWVMCVCEYVLLWIWTLLCPNMETQDMYLQSF